MRKGSGNLTEGKEIPLSAEVNASLKNVDFYNHNGKKVNIAEAPGEKKKAPVLSLNRGNEEKQQRKKIGRTIYYNVEDVKRLLEEGY